MPTQAISAYGIGLRVGNGLTGTVLNVTNATNTSPVVVTTSTPHGVTDVAYMTSASIGGNAGANGTFIVSAVTATTLRLRGSVGTGAYTSGGTITPADTFFPIPEITNIEDAGLMAQLVDVSAHDGNGYASRIPTFLSGNAMRVSINYVPANATHNASTGLLFLLSTRARRRFLHVMPDAVKTAWLWTAWVGNDRIQTPVAGALIAQVTLEIDGAPLLTAA
jgi:hypothetical protein